MRWEHALKQITPRQLARFGVTEAIQLLHLAGDAIPRDEAFLHELIERTGGEPLYLRFLTEDVTAWSEAASERLRQAPPPRNVEDYFRQQARTLYAHKDTTSWHMLGLLVVARGPLSLNDMAEALEISNAKAQDYNLFSAIWWAKSAMY